MTEEKVEEKTLAVESQDQPIDNVAESQLSDEQKINWKKFREQKEVLRKEKDEAQKLAAKKDAEAKAMKEALDSILNNQNQPQAHYQNDSSYEDEDTSIQKKIDAAIAKREEQYKKEQQQREMQELPRRIQQQYPDFDKVCSEENADYLEFHHPEIASSFKYMPESIEKWGNLYKAIKKLVPGIGQDNTKSRIEKNMSKPQSMSSSAVNQMGDSTPQQLSDKQKADNWNRMQKIIKGI